jgi:hypothetical protein
VILEVGKINKIFIHRLILPLRPTFLILITLTHENKLHQPSGRTRRRTLRTDSIEAFGNEAGNVWHVDFEEIADSVHLSFFEACVDLKKSLVKFENNI